MKFDKTKLVLISHFLPSKNILWICGSLFIVFGISLYVFLTPRMSQEQMKKVAECENLWHGTPVMDKTNTVMVKCDHSSSERMQEEFRQANYKEEQKRTGPSFYDRLAIAGEKERYGPGCNFKIKELENSIKLYNDSQKTEKRGDNDGSFVFCFEKKELGEVFYSNKINSCLNVERTYTNCSQYENGPYHISYEYYFLVDSFSKNEIDSVRTISRREEFQKYSDVVDMINKYK